MAKISELPIAGPLTGTEPVILVQDDEAKQSPIGTLVEQVAQPYINAAADQAGLAATYASTAGAVVAETTRVVIGPTTSNAGTASTSTNTFIPSVFFPFDGYLDVASLYSDAGGAGNVQFKIVRRNTATPANFDLISELTPRVQNAIVGVRPANTQPAATPRG